MSPEVNNFFRESLGKIAVLGWYGDFNVGNDALLLGLLFRLAKSSPSNSLTVFSWHPRVTARLYGVNAVFYHKILSVIPKVNALIVGGGSLLTDWRLTLPLFIFLALIVCWAKSLGKKIILYGVGVERFYTRIGKFLARKIVDAADIIVVRGYHSVQELKGLGYNGKVFLEEDIALALPAPSKRERTETLRRILGSETLSARGDFKVIICPKHCSEINKIKRTLAEVADLLIEDLNAKVVFLPMSTSLYDDDRKIIEEIVRLSRRREEIIFLKGRYTPQEVMSLINWSDLVISMRLHPLIFSVKMGKPAIALAGASTPIAPPSIYKISETIEYINRRNAQENTSRIRICHLNVDSSQLIDEIKDLLFIQRYKLGIKLTKDAF